MFVRAPLEVPVRRSSSRVGRYQRAQAARDLKRYHRAVTTATTLDRPALGQVVRVRVRGVVVVGRATAIRF